MAKPDELQNGSDEKPTLSDWITFLSSESNINTSMAFGLSAFVVALLAVIISVYHNTWLGVVVLIIFVAFMGYYVWIFVPKMGRHASKARRLLYDLMSGKQRDVSKIEKAWIDFLDSERQRRGIRKLSFK